MADVTATSTDATSSPKEGTTGSGPKPTIKNVDMSEEMQQECVDIASTALEKYNIEKDIAAQIKKELDRRHGATWHVVVGKNFGSYVTHGELFGPSSYLFLCFPPKYHYIGLSIHFIRLFPSSRQTFTDNSSKRNQTLHILLCRVPCLSYLEVIGLKRCWSWRKEWIVRWWSFHCCISIHWLLSLILQIFRFRNRSFIQDIINKSANL